MLLTVAAMIVSMAIPPFASAKNEIYKNWRGLAIKGYDPVAFHTGGRPLKGSADYELEWKDATWRFASAEHRDLFKTIRKDTRPVMGGIEPGPSPKDPPRALIPKNMAYRRRQVLSQLQRQNTKTAGRRHLGQHPKSRRQLAGSPLLRLSL